MTTAERSTKGGEFLIEETTAVEVFTPEDFSEEQRQLADTAEHFMGREVLPNGERIENHDFALVASLLKRAGELGLLMIDVPEEYGGLELDKATSALVAEKIFSSSYSGFAGAYGIQTGLGTIPLVYYGTKEQKEKYLGRIITGELITAYCLTEPDAGSDALGAKTSAVLSADGRDYVLNGTKQFITNWGIAGLYTVFAKVDREHFTAFLVERSFPGVSAGPEEKKLGIRGTSTTAVILEDARVPVENVLGEVGKGHKIAFNILNIGRFKLGAVVTGAAKVTFAEGARYANARRQFGVPIATFGAIREKIADGVADIFRAESIVYRVAGLLDRRLASIEKGTPNYYGAYQKEIEEYAVECAIAKVYCSEAFGRIADEALQIHGGYGYIQEYPVERHYRDARINRIFEGTNEINRLLISGTLLKRAMKGEIDLMPGVMKAAEILKAGNPASPEGTGPFAAEHALLANLKSVFLAVAGSAVRRHMEKLRDEQEILMALAEAAIEIFAMESTVLRAGKASMASTESRAETMAAAVKVCAVGGAAAVRQAAARAAAYTEEGKRLAGLVERIETFCRYDPSGLLAAKRTLATAALEIERYIF
ncbi:MAG: acyl-CoA dehydrogenase [Deltaproteobacteria bacterium]|nr:MAG: acyl-CoA dehydrogenase [Deltaproteobacteria bacterium]